MYLDIPAWDAPEGVSGNYPLRKSFVKTDTNGTTVVAFDGFIAGTSGTTASASLASINGVQVAVYYNNGVYYGAFATKYTKTF